MERYTVVYGDDKGRTRTYPLREGVKREDIPRAIETASGRRLELKSVVAVDDDADGVDALVAAWDAAKAVAS